MKSFKNTYYLVLRKSSKTYGIVEEIKVNNSIQGGISYEYFVTYSVAGRRYELIELYSPDSLAGLSIADTVLVNYSVSYPRYSTLKRDSSLFFHLGLSILIVAIEIILIIKSCKILNEWHKKFSNSKT
jgi:hypothetical protein